MTRRDKLRQILGGPMLTLYAVYLAIMAVNGITECFAFASMDTRAVSFDIL